MKKLLILASIFLASSCTFISQETYLKPIVRSDSSTIGHSKKINLVVLDKRLNKQVIGKRGNGMVSIANINNHQQLNILITENLKRLLEKKDFKIGSGKVLEVTLVNLEYKNSMGLFHIGSESDADLNVKVKDNGAILYQELFRGRVNKEHFMFAPFAEENEKNINAALEQALQKIANDKDLFEVLAK